MNKKRYAALSAMMAGTTAIFVLAGCGSGRNPVNRGPGYFTPGPVVYSGSATDSITRADEETISEDAKVLSTREATGAFVSLVGARAFDVDLAKIRAAYPAVQKVHARLQFEPKTLLVTVKPTAPWLPTWNESAAAPYTITDTNLTTGEPTLDALLQKYNATRTANPQDLAGGRYFVLRFARSLNMRAVSVEFAQSSPNFVSANVNGTFGDGDNIMYYGGDAKGVDKRYVFTQGYGDCFAGCINHYTHTYTSQADGTFSEEITGTPPPSSNVFGGVNPQ